MLDTTDFKRAEHGVDRDEFIEKDRILGAVLTDWVAQHQDAFTTIVLQGPLPAPGMDPTWLLHLTAPLLEAEVIVFLGPYVEVAYWNPTPGTPTAEVRHDGHDRIGPEELGRVLDQLLALM